VTKRLADGEEYLFWTFGGGVPGLIFNRVREGDLFECHLGNHPTGRRRATARRAEIRFPGWLGAPTSPALALLGRRTELAAAKFRTQDVRAAQHERQTFPECTTSL